MSIREHFSRNERNRRTVERGKAPRRDRVAAEVTSRTPVVRKRINPATGRPHTDDPMMHRVRNEGLGKRKRAGDQEKAAEKFVQDRYAAQDREYEAWRKRANTERARQAAERDSGWERDSDAFRSSPGRTAR